MKSTCKRRRWAASGAWTAALGLAVALPAPAQPDALERLGRPPVKRYTIGEGLPNNTVGAIVRDARGYLWVATQGGAAFYNGAVWRTAALPQGRAAPHVASLLASSDGSVWFGTLGGGVARLHEGAWSSYDARSGLPNDWVRSLAETGSAGHRLVWAATDGGLARFDGGSWQGVSMETDRVPQLVRKLLVTTDTKHGETLWAGGDGGAVARLRAGHWERILPLPGSPRDTILGLAVTVGDAGLGEIVWAATRRSGVLRVENGRWRGFGQAQGLPHEGTRCLLADAEGGPSRALFVGTDGGLARLELATGEIRTFTGAQWPDAPIQSLLLAEAQGGGAGLWVGTLGGGLVRFAAGDWLAYDRASGLPHDTVHALLESRAADGSKPMWFGTGRGLARFHAGRFERVPALAGATVTSLLPAPDARPTDSAVWAGTTTEGLWRVEGLRATRVGDAAVGPGTAISALLATRAHDGESLAWAATFGGGLARWRNGRWNAYATAGTGLPNARVFALAETHDVRGRHFLWVGTWNGLARHDLDSGAWSTYSTAQGLPVNAIWSLLARPSAERAETLWIGTGGGGVAQLSLGDAEPRCCRLLSTETEPALPDDTVNHLEADGRGRVYVFTNKGVARLTALRAGSDFGVHTFGEEDGLPSLETDTGAGLVDSQGRVWAGTVAGAAMLPAERGAVPALAPRSLRLERVLVGDQARAGLDGTRLSYDQNNLRFEFALLSFFRERDTRYRTFLHGFDNEPTGWSAEAVRVFTRLPAGSYQLEAWGADAAGVVSAPLRLSFVVGEAPWRTWPAYLLYAALLAFTGYGVQRRRSARELHLERLRTRIATDLHDDVGATLTQIAALGELTRARTRQGELEQADASAARSAELARESAQAMRDIVWAVDPEKDQFRDLVARMRRFASETLEARGLELSFGASGAEGRRLDPDVRREVYMVFKEALNNLLRHSGAGRAWIVLEERRGELGLSVRDDGRGFDPHGSSAGNGLASLRRRAERAGGRLEIASAPGAGTTVSLHVPARRRS